MQDARGRRHRGAVTWSDALETPLRAPGPPRAFHIAVVRVDPGRIAVPPRVAVCVPARRPMHVIEPETESPPLPRRIDELTLPLALMREYAQGRILIANEGLIAPGDVFPPHADRPRLDRLARALVEAAEAEASAPYVALIRRELTLPASVDALAALEDRLAPADPSARPPARAPGIVRLARAARRLRDGGAPDTPLEQFAEDLRFLRLFDPDEPFPVSALDRLLGDVRAEPLKRTRASAKVVPISRRRKRT